MVVSERNSALAVYLKYFQIGESKLRGFSKAVIHLSFSNILSLKDNFALHHFRRKCNIYEFNFLPS